MISLLYYSHSIIVYFEPKTSKTTKWKKNWVWGLEYNVDLWCMYVCRRTYANQSEIYFFEQPRDGYKSTIFSGHLDIWTTNFGIRWDSPSRSLTRFTISQKWHPFSILVFLQFLSLIFFWYGKVNQDMIWRLLYHFKNTTFLADFLPWST